MDSTLLLTIALLVLPVVLLLAFSGCLGEDVGPYVQAKEEAEKKAADAEKKVAEDATAKVESKYDKKLAKETKLVSWWRLDDGQPETGDLVALDSAKGAPSNGQYKNLPGLRRGEKGAVNVDKNAAVEFLGTVGYVEVPFDPLRNPPMAFSLELWVLPDPQPDATPPQVLVGSYETNASGQVVRGFALELLYGPVLRVRGRVGNDGVQTTLEASLGDGLQLSGWRHVVMTYNGAAQQLQLYVNADDGKADATLPTAALPAPVGYKANAAMPLRIGAGNLELPVPATPGLFFKGRIDEVALYNAELSGPSIREHFLAATA